jgi:hypothetical protein
MRKPPGREHSPTAANPLTFFIYVSPNNAVRCYPENADRVCGYDRTRGRHTRWRCISLNDIGPVIGSERLKRAHDIRDDYLSFLHQCINDVRFDDRDAVSGRIRDEQHITGCVSPLREFSVVNYLSGMFASINGRRILSYMVATGSYDKRSLSSSHGPLRMYPERDVSETNLEIETTAAAPYKSPTRL